MYKILFVDDEPNICEGLKLIVDWEREGFGIAGAVFNGSEALVQLDQTAADVIITDVRMPEMSGIELIKKLYEKKYPAKIIVISGYMEFEYAREALYYGVKNYILKPINREELENTVRLLKKELDHETTNELLQRKREEFVREKLFWELVKTGVWKKTDYEIGDWGRRLEEYSYSVLVVQFEQNESAGQDDPNEWKDGIPKQMIKAAIRDTIEKYECGYLFEPDEQNMLGALLYSREQNMNVLKETVMPELFKTISRAAKGMMIIALGNEAKSVAGIPESFRNSCRAIKWQRLMQGSGMTFYDDIEHVFHAECNWDHTVLLSKVQECDEAGILHELERLSQEAETLIQSDKALYSIMIHTFIELASMISESGGNAKSIIDIGSDADYVYADNSDQQLIEYIKAACIQTACYIKKKRGNFDHAVLNDIVQYVNGNYNKDISLTTLSQKFFLNQGYIGKLFKKHTGMGFVDFLNKTRIEKAAKMLEEGYLKNYEISEEVGYRDLNYFYQIFKKIKGMSPVEYKKNIRTHK